MPVSRQWSPCATPPFPRSGPAKHGSPTSSVLRRRYDFLHRIPAHLLVSLAGTTSTSAFVLAEALPCGRRHHTGLDLWSAGGPMSRQSSRGRIQDLPGSLTILPVPLPSSRTPVGSTPLANHGVSMLPPRRRPRRLQRLELFRGLPLGFSTCCLRFKSPLAGTQARLASGWPALSLYRAGVEPAGPLRKVSGHLHGLPPFQGFPWRYFDRRRSAASSG